MVGQGARNFAVVLEIQSRICVHRMIRAQYVLDTKIETCNINF
jgi:hypothetical protein